MIRLDVVIINREGPSCAVLSEMEKDQAVLRSCCIPLTRHLVMRVGFVDSPMRMALCISYFVNTVNPNRKKWLTIEGIRRYDVSAEPSTYDPEYSVIPKAPLLEDFVLNLESFWHDLILTQDI